MKMKERLLNIAESSLLVVFLICMSMVSIVVTAYAAGVEIDCYGSLQAYAIDPRMRNYFCDCRNGPRSTPVCKPKSGATGSSGGYSGGSPQQQIQQMIFQSLFDSLFAQPDNSHQEQLKQQEEEKRKAAEQAAEQAKKAALQKWLQMQTEEVLQRKMEQEAKIKQGEKVLSQMQTVGGGKLEPFGFGNPKLDLKPIGQTYPAPSTAWEQALCSAYFSNLAKQSTKDVDARFYGDQAQRVTVGEPTYLECRMPQVSNEKLAKRMKEVKEVYDEMNTKIKDLEDIEAKLTETRDKIKDAELKKEEATAKLAELQNQVATAKPEEKAEMDDLVRQAMEQEQIADQQLNQAKESEKDALNKKEQLENELKNMNAKIQTGGE
jgi:hypothetical protein